MLVSALPTLTKSRILGVRAWYQTTVLVPPQEITHAGVPPGLIAYVGGSPDRMDQGRSPIRLSWSERQ